ncbi:MAG TPA: CHAT domain-containing protein [Bacteroidetes bacterium]|nr:CHAT domain-containing protein [Bacteroidota bacterium]
MYWKNPFRIVLLVLHFAIMQADLSVYAQTEAQTLFAQGMSQRAARDFVAASLSFAASAVAAAEKQAWDEWAEARIKGGACLGKDGQFVEAIDHYLNLRSELSGKMADSLVWPYQIRIDRSLAYYYNRLGAGDLSIRYQQEALQTQIRSGSPAGKIAKTYLNIGSQLVRKNDMVHATTYLEAGLPLAAGHPMLESRIWTNLGAAAVHSGDPERGAQAFEIAIKLRKAMRPPVPEALASAHLFLAGAHFDLHEVDAAEKDLQQVQFLLKNCEDCDELVGDLYGHRATLLKEREDFAGAISEAELAVSHFKSANPFGREVALQLVENGLMRHEMGQAAAALSDFRGALSVLLPEYRGRGGDTLPELDSLRTDPWIFLALQGLADAAYLNYSTGKLEKDLEMSVAALALALDQASLVRRAFASEEARLNLNGKIYLLYEKAIVRALELAEQSGDSTYEQLAFSFAEQGKAAVLLEEIAQARSMVKFGLPDSVQARLQALDLNYRYFRQCAQTDTSQRSRDCARRRDATLLERDQLMLTIRDQYPAYHAARYQASPIDIATIQQRLRPGEALVEYFFGDSNLVVFLITADQFLSNRQSLSPDLEAHIRGLRKTLSAVGGSKELAAFRTHARALYLQVAAPWVDRLGEGTTSITIVPDGLLSYVPFEVLLGSEPGEAIYPTLPYLIRDYRFSYGYSASLRYRAAATAPQKDRQVLACALSFTQASSNALRSSPDREHLPALPNALAEAEAIRKSFAGRFLLDDQATETAFRELSPQYSMLHLATHTIFNDSNPDATRIVFAGSDPENDGYLHAYELYGLQLDADLAVLSACQTGDGELLRGEGVMSLGRAFTYAGCRSTIMTLWPLNDRASEKIMSAFYGYLAQGMARDEALHTAKLEFLNAQRGPRANPFYWAGFIHSGEAGPVIEAGLPFELWILPVGGAPVLLLLLLLFLRRRAHHRKEKVRI